MPAFTTGKDAKTKQLKIAGLGIVGFLALLILGMYLSDPNAGKKSMLEIKKEQEKEAKNNYRTNSGASPEETWVSISEERFAQLSQENTLLKRDISEMKRMLKSIGAKDAEGETERVNNIDRKVSEKPGEPVSKKSGLPIGNGMRVNQQPDSSVTDMITRKALPPVPQRRRAAASQSAQGQAQPANTIYEVSLVDENKDKNKQGEKLKHINSFIPAGSFSKVVLMNGINAPTGGQASQNPVPVLMRVMDNGQLPNRFKSAIRNCHITGAATGDMASEIAHIRLEKMSCVLINGDVITSNVKGYVAGESGAAGFRGRVVERTGALIAKTLFSGIAGGLSKSIEQQYQTVSTSALGAVQSIDTDKVGQAGLANGASSSLEMLSQYYMDRANEIYPIIEINPKRIGEVVFLDGVDLGSDLLANAANK
jgi:conjugal transfer pilus assembly protein TraB